MAITTANPFVRRGALALVNLQKTAMSPTGGSAVDHYTDPQLPNGHVEAGNTRDLFPAWPSSHVAKIKKVGGDALKNLLRLRCRSSTIGMSTDGMMIIDPDTFGFSFIVTAQDQVSLVNQSAIWSLGDDKLYASVTVKHNLYRGLNQNGDPEWAVETAVFNLGLNGELVLTSSSIVDPSPSEDTFSNAFLGNGTTFAGEDYNAAEVTVYAQFSTEVNYIDFIDNYSSSGTTDTYSEEKQVFRSGRLPTQDPHGLAESYVTTGVQSSGNSDRIITEVVNPSTSLIRNGLFTYKLANSADATVFIQRDLVKARWLFTPAGCSPCPFAGKEVEVKVRFKQATVTRTLAPASQYTVDLSIGSWSSHSEQTFTLTLPDSMTEQTLDSEFDFPSVAGSVVAIDDIEIVSVGDP
jgi:hypothetical protein